MNTRHRLLRGLALSAGIILLGAARVLAQGSAVPCSAFVRNTHGGWRVMAPVMLDLDGRLYSPMVGTVLSAGAAQHGIEMSDVLDQQCSNR